MISRIFFLLLGLLLMAASLIISGIDKAMMNFILPDAVFYLLLSGLAFVLIWRGKELGAFLSHLRGRPSPVPVAVSRLLLRTLWRYCWQILLVMLLVNLIGSLGHVEENLRHASNFNHFGHLLAYCLYTTFTLLLLKGLLFWPAEIVLAQRELEEAEAV